MPRPTGGASDDARSKHDRYALGCKAIWVLVHVAAIYLMLHLDTQIHREQQERRPWSRYFLATMLLLNSALYISLCTLRPCTDAAKSNCGSKVHPRVAAVQPDVVTSRSPRQRSAASSSSGDKDNNPTERTPLAATFAIGVHYEEGSDPEYCRECDANKALRTHHCSMCRRCIPGYDHHCVWVGRCIGRHNHGTFWLFLLTQTTLAVFSLHQFLTGMRHSAQIAWGQQQWLGMASTMAMLVAAVLIGGLLFFHTYLLTTNQTSKEVLAREAVPYLQQYPLEVAPFHAGCCLNLYNLVRRPEECDRLRVVVDSGRLLPLDAARNSRGGSLWDNDYYSCF